MFNLRFSIYKGKYQRKLLYFFSNLIGKQPMKENILFTRTLIFKTENGRLKERGILMKVIISNFSCMTIFKE